MPALSLTKSEIGTLHTLKYGPVPSDELAPTEVDRLMAEGLVETFGNCFHITLKGQVEILRQRFRGVTGHTRVLVIDEAMADRSLFMGEARAELFDGTFLGEKLKHFGQS